MDNKHLAHLLDIEIPEGFVPDVEMIRPFGPRLLELSRSLPVEPLKRDPSRADGEEEALFNQVFKITDSRQTQ